MRGSRIFAVGIAQPILRFNIQTVPRSALEVLALASPEFLSHNSNTSVPLSEQQIHEADNLLTVPLPAIAYSTPDVNVNLNERRLAAPAWSYDSPCTVINDSEATCPSPDLADAASTAATASLQFAINGQNFVEFATVVPILSDYPPMASNDVVAVSEGALNRLAVLSNDSVAFGSLTVSTVSASVMGIVGVCGDGSCVEYTPKIRFQGFDTVRYTVTDGRGRSASATVQVQCSSSLSNILQPVIHFY